MTYFAGIQMFMEKLNHLINCKNNPSININAIRRRRPQLQLLHEELGSMIQTLFINEYHDLHELEKFSDLKKRFTYAAEEAEYIVDLFLSDVHVREKDDSWRPFKCLVDLFLSCVHNSNDEHLLNLDDVWRSFESIKEEFMSMRSVNIEMDSSKKTLNQPAAAGPAGSKKLFDEIMVGIDDDVELIRDKLVEDQKKLDVVSVVGMGGLGKTTLATKVFNDRFIMHHFHVRVWITVSQTYDKRGVLIQILESIRGQLHLETATDSRLRELVHKHLMGRRYLIVIDDIWDTQTWDQIKLFFPHDNTGSRILLTTRLIEVAKHANSNGLIHHLGYLNNQRSWELLCQKVFHGNEFPEWSIEPGMQIVKNCRGLPLSVIVIAGILAKEAWNRKLWEEIAYKTGSYIVGDQNGCLETLALSYNNLPLHMRECFLYLGHFPEDHKFEAESLVWLWVAEGFIQQAGNGSLEDIAESYLMDLIDRNLVIVTDIRGSNGAVKFCILHDLVRELCLRKAKEEGFFLQIERLMSAQYSNVITPPYKPVRMFINKDINILRPSAQNLRSIILFAASYLRPPMSDDIAMHSCSLTLLRVLDLQSCILNDFPEGMELLVHLRYLAIWKDSTDFPSSICKLWGLQTLIFITSKYYGRLISRKLNIAGMVNLPENMSDMVNLRHLRGSTFYLRSIQKPMNLRTISAVALGYKAGTFQKCFPYIKELECFPHLGGGDCDFKSLTRLEKLKITCYVERNNCITLNDCIALPLTFPVTLRELTLYFGGLPWSRMSIIQSLPNLQILKLKDSAFVGNCWNTDGYEFRQLTFLKLQDLDIEQWEACSTIFPCLRQLHICHCTNLKKIPLEIGDIPTLELIRCYGCDKSLEEPLRIIEEEQHDLGNYDLKIVFKSKLMDRLNRFC